ncbi:hypothetical protein GUITHDRAFT_146205 [Guillardia theta CCMP2712]|uniref:C2H2-type domain-containing protein n=2 Tax=Guillardia theta TaxID=55529 RepID=L1II14_GUITC|nr:hypothetical protein GUITHDRAFT_146205 [Guillardia theta CCMP2712]EKX35856.1 hypothetical protein GUITHDRAFT_146205 [Guillardia theta CCMP2712]|eukprot:XP_005822836.1 hypothetical protein GUITHDRAFT_146205 [Guillardia theta CCMP2712]
MSLLYSFPDVYVVRTDSGHGRRTRDQNKSSRKSSAQNEEKGAGTERAPYVAVHPDPALPYRLPKRKSFHEDPNIANLEELFRIETEISHLEEEVDKFTEEVGDSCLRLSKENVQVMDECLENAMRRIKGIHEIEKVRQVHNMRLMYAKQIGQVDVKGKQLDMESSFSSTRTSHEVPAECRSLEAFAASITKESVKNHMFRRRNSHTEGLDDLMVRSILQSFMQLCLVDSSYVFNFSLHSGDESSLCFYKSEVESHVMQIFSWENQVFVGCGDGAVYALHGSLGNMLWCFPIDSNDNLARQLAQTPLFLAGLINVMKTRKEECQAIASLLLSLLAVGGKDITQEILEFPDFLFSCGQLISPESHRLSMCILLLLRNIVLVGEEIAVSEILGNSVLLSKITSLIVSTHDTKLVRKTIALLFCISRFSSASEGFRSSGVPPALVNVLFAHKNTTEASSTCIGLALMCLANIQAKEVQIWLNKKNLEIVVKIFRASWEGQDFEGYRFPVVDVLFALKNMMTFADLDIVGIDCNFVGELVEYVSKWKKHEEMQGMSGSDGVSELKLCCDILIKLSASKYCHRKMHDLRLKKQLEDIISSTHGAATTYASELLQEINEAVHTYCVREDGAFPETASRQPKKPWLNSEFFRGSMPVLHARSPSNSFKSIDDSGAEVSMDCRKSVNFKAMVSSAMHSRMPNLWQPSLTEAPSESPHHESELRRRFGCPKCGKTYAKQITLDFHFRIGCSSGEGDAESNRLARVSRKVINKLRFMSQAKAWQCWVEHSELFKFQTKAVQHAVQRWNSRLLSAAFMAWIEESRRISNAWNVLNRVVEHWRHQSTAKSFESWKLYVLFQRCTQVEENGAAKVTSSLPRRSNSESNIYPTMMSPSRMNAKTFAREAYSSGSDVESEPPDTSNGDRESILKGQLSSLQDYCKHLERQNEVLRKQLFLLVNGADAAKEGASEHVQAGQELPPRETREENGGEDAVQDHFQIAASSARSKKGSRKDSIELRPFVSELELIDWIRKSHTWVGTDAAGPM